MSETKTDVEGSVPSWFISIVEGHEEAENNKPEQPNIPKVPDVLLVKGNKACYSPLLVSIGPYHYPDDKKKLSDMEKLKVPMMRQFVRDCEEKELEVLYEEVRKVAHKEKGFYTDGLIKDFTNEEFSKMMFIDGCFVLHFIHCFNYEYEKLKMTDQQIAHVKRDLLLLENQLPFPVLKSLMDLRYGHGIEVIDHFLSLDIRQPNLDAPIWDWILFVPTLIFKVLPRFFALLLLIFMMVALLPLTCLLCYFYCVSFINALKRVFRRTILSIKKKFKKKFPPAHLLELLHSKYIGSEKGKAKKSSQGSRANYLYYSAKNLKRVDIHFRPSQTGALTNVKFKSSIFSGTLQLPPIIIDESTKALLLNLVAYETSAGLHQLWVTSYICFMVSLIKDAEDVEELRSNGIIANYLRSDQEVVEIFSEMAKNLIPDPRAYNGVKKDIDKQRHSILKIWVAECKQKYFSSPWAFIAFVAAALGLILTAISTYKAIFPPKGS